MERIAVSRRKNAAGESMIEQTGTVLSRSQDIIHVRVEAAAGCARCESGQGCGQGLIGQLAGRPAYSIAVEVPASESVAVGSRVVLGMNPASLLGASFLVYLVPILLMVVLAAVVGSVQPGSELLSIVAGIGGLAGGLLVVRRLLRNDRVRRAFEPRFLRRASGSANELLT